MRTVYTTLWPDRPLDVDDAEAADLAAQGLLLPDSDAHAPVRPATQGVSTITDAPEGAEQGG